MCRTPHAFGEIHEGIPSHRHHTLVNTELSNSTYTAGGDASGGGNTRFNGKSLGEEFIETVN